MDSLSFLVDGWLELESDPGLFTLLIEDFGCKGIQVEEIYDLTKVGLIDGHVYGFIFLFKWIEERRSRQRQLFINFQSLNKKKSDIKLEPTIEQPCYVEDENLVNSMFFAHQIIPNSCATHAILSVLLNCKNINLGEILTRLKNNTYCMDPESKGMAIGNMPELAKVHNLHVSYYDRKAEMNNRQPNPKVNVFPRTSTSNSFHFISFVSINNRVYELDGLKKYPIDHGPIKDNETFSEKFRRIILERIPQQQQKEKKLNLQLRKLQTDMNMNTSSDIRYSLMAVVPDRKLVNLKKIKILKLKREILLQVLQKLTRPIRLPDPLEFHNYSKYSPVINYNSQLEINVNKFIINDHNLSNSPQSSNSQISKIKLNEEIDEGNSTDTCSESDLIEFNDNLIDENEKLDNLYAFKFVSLDEKSNTVDEGNDLDNNIQESSIKHKTLSKNELIDFYKNYALKDIINILNQIEHEISIFNKNIQEEIEKRSKFHVDDSRRTHNYNDFISTYLLMLTEQKKLHKFFNKNTNQINLNSNKEFDVNEEVPLKFFKEIVKNYGDVVLNDDLSKTNSNQTKNNRSNYFKRKRAKRTFTCKTDKLNLIES